MFDAHAAGHQLIPALHLAAPGTWSVEEHVLRRTDGKGRNLNSCSENQHDCAETNGEHENMSNGEDEKLFSDALPLTTFHAFHEKFGVIVLLLRLPVAARPRTSISH